MNRTYNHLFFGLFLLSSIGFVFCAPRVKDEVSAPVSKQTGIKDELPDKNFLSDYRALEPDGEINVVVEITAGTLEKWEVDKETGVLKLEHRDGKPRIINYLGYPVNYGMIPSTMLSKEQGGDGDPLDALVLGHPVERGEVVKCRVIGVLKLLDNGELDDKLIAVADGHSLYQIGDIDELVEEFPGICDILKIWFVNYKGEGAMVFTGFGDKMDAEEILQKAITQYKLSSDGH